jgi:hypothetical protein
LAQTIYSLHGPGGLRGRTRYGAETIIRQWTNTYWDRIRYAIGIRDIGLWQYRFDEASELVSVPFTAPLPIRSISLEVDEVIPTQFNRDRGIESWIDYFVGVGDSEEWLPLAPLTSRVVRTLEGNRIPSVIHVNSGIPASERAPGDGYVDLDRDVTTVRFRAVLHRPTDIEEAESFTPSLKSYRLLLTTRGGGR